MPAYGGAAQQCPELHAVPVGQRDLYATPIGPDQHLRLNYVAQLLVTARVAHGTSIRQRRFTVHGFIGITLARMGENREAIIHFQHALRINPNNRLAWNNLQIVIAELEDM